MEVVGGSLGLPPAWPSGGRWSRGTSWMKACSARGYRGSWTALLGVGWVVLPKEALALRGADAVGPHARATYPATCTGGRSAPPLDPPGWGAEHPLPPLTMKVFGSLWGTRWCWGSPLSEGRGQRGTTTRGKAHAQAALFSGRARAGPGDTLAWEGASTVRSPWTRGFRRWNASRGRRRPRPRCPCGVVRSSHVVVYVVRSRYGASASGRTLLGRCPSSAGQVSAQDSPTWGRSGQHLSDDWPGRCPSSAEPEVTDR